MPDVPPLQIYPQLWQESLRAHPTCWQDQFRCLCQLARDYRKNNRAAYRQLPKGERLFLQALDQCDVEDMITTIATEWAPGASDPLGALNPADPYVDKTDPQWRDLYPVQFNGKKYGHA
jgi:hypothetical protein